MNDQRVTYHQCTRCKGLFLEDIMTECVTPEDKWVSDLCPQCIQLAIEEKLGEKFTVAGSTTIMLLAAVLQREDSSEFLKKVIDSEIKLMKQVEEIEEQQ